MTAENDVTKLLEKTYSVNELCKAFGRTRETIRAWRNKYEDFPKPVVLGGRELRFEKTAVNEWWDKYKHSPSSKK